MRSGRRGGNAAWASMGSARVSRPDRASGALREAKREKHRRRTENGRRLGRVSARVPRRPARRGTTRSARGTSRVRAARDRGVTTRVVSATRRRSRPAIGAVFSRARCSKPMGFARPWTPETARRRRRGRPRVLARLSNTHLELIDQHRDVEQVGVIGRHGARCERMHVRLEVRDVTNGSAERSHEKIQVVSRNPTAFVVITKPSLARPMCLIPLRVSSTRRSPAGAGRLAPRPKTSGKGHSPVAMKEGGEGEGEPWFAGGRRAARATPRFL